MGIFYTPGNHEAYSRQRESFYKEVVNYTNMLVDKVVVVNGTQIIGLDYKIENKAETAKRLEACGYKKEMPSIVIMHDPKNMQALSDAGASLVVSGHTHLGQFFPINFIVRAMYKNFAYGATKTGTTTSVTTCGVGTAMSPVRLGTNPEIVVIKVTA